MNQPITDNAGLPAPRPDLKERLRNRLRQTIWLRDLHWNLSDRQQERATARRLKQAEEKLALARHTLSSLGRLTLTALLDDNATLRFPIHESPEVSILLVLFNRAELTLNCLRSILETTQPSYEVVIVDNASSDETGKLLERLEGATILRNDTNLNFLLASNQAAQAARGRYLLFLNNDAQLLPGSLQAALEAFESPASMEKVGAVGGKIILPNGALQEAGSIVWRDGSCLGYDRDGDPFAGPAMFRRNVDYCSGAFLVTPRALFAQLGGFDEAYQPAYYEEADYCVRLWQEGYRVVYEPRAAILHHEFASSRSRDDAIALQLRNRETFARKNASYLATRHVSSPAAVLRARHARHEGKRLLFLEDRVPRDALGSGYPRATRIVREMTALGHFVTLYPIHVAHEEWSEVYRDIPREVEVMPHMGVRHLRSFLRERQGYYDLCFISRPHDMQAARRYLFDETGAACDAPVVYDAEAIYALREVEYRRMMKREMPAPEVESLIESEVALARGCRGVTTVSEAEAEHFRRRGIENVWTLGHAVEAAPTPRPFEARRDLLFVGALHRDSPNSDSMFWFVHEILPLIQQQTLGGRVRLDIAGPVVMPEVHTLESETVRVLGTVADLTPLYDAARVFVAPTRFSAGVPLKVYEAAAHGLPVVATSLLARQLGWRDGIELLVADDPAAFAARCQQLLHDSELWHRVRENALQRIAVDGSAQTFRDRLSHILDASWRSA